MRLPVHPLPFGTHSNPKDAAYRWRIQESRWDSGTISEPRLGRPPPENDARLTRAHASVKIVHGRFYRQIQSETVICPSSENWC